MTVTLDAARSLAAWGLAERGRGAMREEAWERGGGEFGGTHLVFNIIE